MENQDCILPAISPLPNATDADRRAYLLEQLHSRPRPWTARFRCIIAISAPDG